MTRSSLAATRRASSAAGKRGVSCQCSTNSPKALGGTLTPENTSPPAAAHASVPPLSTLKSVYPAPASTAAARAASDSSCAPSVTRVIGTFKRGRRVASNNSIRLSGRQQAKNRCRAENAPSSRGSSSANSAPEAIRSRSCTGDKGVSDGIGKLALMPQPGDREYRCWPGNAATRRYFPCNSGAHEVAQAPARTYGNSAPYWSVRFQSNAGRRA